MSKGKKRGAILGVVAIAFAVIGFLYYSQADVLTTDNAYLKSQHVYVNAQVSGPIVAVYAEQYQHLDAGDLIFEVDPVPYQLKVQQLEAQRNAFAIDLAKKKRRLEELQVKKTLLLEDFRYAREEWDREKNLTDRGLNAEQDLAAKRHDLQRFERAVAVGDADINTALSDLLDQPDLKLQDHPTYKVLQSQLDQALRDLVNTAVRAPIAGLLIEKPVLGTHAERGRPITSVVDIHDVWVEANFLETDVARLTPGLVAEVHVDTYPDKVWPGRVASLSPATGAEFAILPPQNATGNWVKITQRVPVRIALEARYPDAVLRKGMTAHVTVFPAAGER
ncbi:MAG: HlyD family secretion protein [Halieaceae bacterium]|nr:HlyD family secretion protein [Halieaceae bacterium]